MYDNSTGFDNTAIGYDALGVNIVGTQNTGVGFGSLYLNTGDNNTALGQDAGSRLTSGSNNIDIGDADIQGVSDEKAGEANTIRIGEFKTQKTTYIAGIYGQTVDAGAKTVVIDADGQLGTVIAASTSSINSNDLRDAVAKLQASNCRLQATVARQQADFQRQIKDLTATIKEQASLLQKVSAEVQAGRPSPQVVSNTY